MASSKIQDDIGYKKGHICPPSDATHPSGRWETAFVYSFITKFTNLRSKVEGFESQEDLEEALLSPTQHPIMVQILSRFILNLKPQTRNLNADQISSTLSMVLQEYMKSTERSVFWDHDNGGNKDPLINVEGGFWGAEWRLKLLILKQLVDYQLSHTQEIKEIIDRAWGVVHNKHRKRESLAAPPDPSDPHSMERLQTVSIGQDQNRKRFWIFDDSPRLFISTNPWKTNSEFKLIASTKEEYLKVLEDLKDSVSGKEKLTRPEYNQVALVTALENRLEAIDLEVARIQRVRKKLEQKEILRAQAELRTTRTRRQARRPDYVYGQEYESDEGGDDYTYEEDDDDEEQIDQLEDEELGGPAGRNGERRSGRIKSLRTTNGNGKRQIDTLGEWRGERRSSRLGISTDDASSSKRARTEERSVSSAPSDTMPTSAVSNGSSVQNSGVASVKPNEVIVDTIAGKKKSRFWVYAVEPVQELASTSSSNATLRLEESASNGVHNGGSYDPNYSKTFPMGQNGRRYSASPSPMSIE